MTSFSSKQPSASAFTWPELLRLRAETGGAKVAFTFLQSGEEVTGQLTYADLDRRARAIAVALSERCAPGDRVLLLFPSGLDFLTAFFGCLYAGVVAVPAYPPRANKSIHRLTAIVADAGARVALTTRAMLTASTHLTPENLAIHMSLEGIGVPARLNSSRTSAYSAAVPVLISRN